MNTLPANSSAATPPEAAAEDGGAAEAMGRELVRLREMLEQNSDWIWEVDAQGRYTYASRQCVALLGREPEEVVGRTPFDFMPPDEAERVGRIFGAIAAERRPSLRSFSTATCARTAASSCWRRAACRCSARTAICAAIAASTGT